MSALATMVRTTTINCSCGRPIPSDVIGKVLESHERGHYDGSKRKKINCKGEGGCGRQWTEADVGWASLPNQTTVDGVRTKIRGQVGPEGVLGAPAPKPARPGAGALSGAGISASKPMIIWTMTYDEESRNKQGRLKGRVTKDFFGVDPSKLAYDNVLLDEDAGKLPNPETLRRTRAWVQSDGVKGLDILKATDPAVIAARKKNRRSIETELGYDVDDDGAPARA